MKPSLAAVAGSALAGLLLVAPAAEPRAEPVVRLAGGFATTPDHHRSRHHRKSLRGPRHSHGVPFVRRDRGRAARAPRRSHGVPFVSREPRRHGRGPHVLGSRDRHVLGAGCRPYTRRGYDRHGHLVIEHLSLCYDRHGQAHIIGGGR